MNSKDSSLLRIERALDRVERTLKMIDTRVSQLHAAANFSKNKNNSTNFSKNKNNSTNLSKNKNTRRTNAKVGYFAAKSKPPVSSKQPTLFGRGHRQTNENFVKLKINPIIY